MGAWADTVAMGEGVAGRIGRGLRRFGRLSGRGAVASLRTDLRLLVEGLRGRRRPPFELRAREARGPVTASPTSAAAEVDGGLVRHALGPERIILVTPDAPESLCAGVARVEVHEAGEVRRFEAPGGESMLDGAFEGDVDLPYSCRAGGCAACRVRLVRGTVVMPSHHCLSPEELREGYVLTCVGHAAGDVTLEVE